LTHTGILTRFDAKTGEQSYKVRIGEGGDFTSSPWAYSGRIFCMNEEGKTYVIQAGENYKLLGSNDLGEMALATPALIADRLILRTENHVYSIRKKRK
jgi:outer membrane protein assembly factor BamB